MKKKDVMTSLSLSSALWNFGTESGQGTRRFDWVQSVKQFFWWNKLDKLRKIIIFEIADEDFPLEAGDVIDTILWAPRPSKFWKIANVTAGDAIGKMHVSVKICKPSLPPKPPAVQRIKALYSFTKKNPPELSFNQDDVMMLIARIVDSSQTPNVRWQ